MRSPFRALAAALLAAGLAGCASGPDIRADQDPAANLSAYRTFGFFEPLATNKAGYSTILSARLKDAARRELETRGYEYDAVNPELLVNFNLNIQEKTEIRSTPSASAGYGYYGYRAGMYGAWSGYPYDVETTNYKQGTLTVDVVDAGRKELVWQGVAEGRVSKKAMENPAAAIDAVMPQIFAKFPGRNPAPAAP